MRDNAAMARETLTRHSQPSNSPSLLLDFVTGPGPLQTRPEARKQPVILPWSLPVLCHILGALYAIP